MKVYEGKRTIDGLVVTVDGRQLSEHYEVQRFTSFGFEWSYEGASPRQLALAILVDHFGDRDKAVRLSQPFMKAVIANLDNDWQLSGSEIDAAIRDLDASQ
jgi:hypothetical protein